VLQALRRVDRRRLLIGATWIVVLAYGWWFTDREPFSPGAFRALMVAVAGVIIVATVRRRRFAPARRAAAARSSQWFRSAVVVWSVVAAAVLAWELLALRSLPRSAHPTISSITESVEQFHLTRLALYAGWIWFGWMLAS
jgi:drug/metabolite transporter (DMT)-like permease